MTVLQGGRVVTPDGVLDDGWVSVEDGRIHRDRPRPRPIRGTDLVEGGSYPGSSTCTCTAEAATT